MAHAVELINRAALRMDFIGGAGVRFELSVMDADHFDIEVGEPLYTCSIVCIDLVARPGSLARVVSARGRVISIAVVGHTTAQM